MLIPPAPRLRCRVSVVTNSWGAASINVQAVSRGIFSSQLQSFPIAGNLPPRCEVRVHLRLRQWVSFFRGSIYYCYNYLYSHREERVIARRASMSSKTLVVSCLLCSPGFAVWTLTSPCLSFPNL